MDFVKIANIEIATEVFDRMVVRCNELGCDVADFIEQALTYAMDNEDPDWKPVEGPLEL